LVGRIPAGALALLDDLFRAKFTGVRKFAAPGEIVSGRRPVARPDLK
jgi:hypothetical protein